MALYEITFLTKEETDPGIRQAIEAAGGLIQSEHALGRRRLAYPIHHETQAVFTTYVFDIDASAITSLTRKFGLNSNLLRYLLVTKPVSRAKKEVSKTVREAIAAAEKLADVTDEMKQEVVPSYTDRETEQSLTDTPVEPEKPTAQETEVQSSSEPVTGVVTPEEPSDDSPATQSKSPRQPKTTKLAPQPKAAEQDSAAVTEEDRLKALEEKLGEILKD